MACAGAAAPLKPPPKSDIFVASESLCEQMKITTDSSKALALLHNPPAQTQYRETAMQI
jgi:hypothetical protein